MLKLVLNYCKYASLVLLCESLVIIFSYDASISFGASIRSWLFSSPVFYFVSAGIFFFCIINIFVLIIFGITFLFYKEYYKRGILFIISSIFCFLIIQYYIGDSW